MLPTSLLVSLHIMAAVVGIIAGVLAMVLRKGSGGHHVAGNVFVIAMLLMSLSAAWLAAFVRPQPMNVVVSILTAYLVATGWRAGRSRQLISAWYDSIGGIVVAADGVAALTLGIGIAAGRIAPVRGVPLAPYFLFGTIAILFASGDLRFMLRRTLAGALRLRRHLVRMSVALLIALLSFFPGQARQLPESLRNNTLFYVPHVIVAGILVLWLARLRVRRRGTPTISLKNERSSHVESLSAAAVRSVV